jgi:hypothetical protein
LLIHKVYLGTGPDQAGEVQGPLLVFRSATLVRAKEKTPLGLNLEVSEVGECRLTVRYGGRRTPHRSLVEHPMSPMSTNFIKLYGYPDILYSGTDYPYRPTTDAKDKVFKKHDNITK